eukprot:2536563-Rhodomonas_salina.2
MPSFQRSQGSFVQRRPARAVLGLRDRHRDYWSRSTGPWKTRMWFGEPDFQVASDSPSSFFTQCHGGMGATLNFELVSSSVKNVLILLWAAAALAGTEAESFPFKFKFGRRPMTSLLITCPWAPGPRRLWSDSEKWSRVKRLYFLR